MKQLKQSEVKELREELLKRNDNKCPLCENDLPKEKAALDHCHQTGRVRNTICKNCNSLEGMMRSKWIRSGVAQQVTFERFLLNLSNYLLADHPAILHPTHAPKPRKLMKSSYNKLVREIKNCNRFMQKPEKIVPYSKSGRLTKRLGELFLKYGIKPEYYGRK